MLERNALGGSEAARAKHVRRGKLTGARGYRCAARSGLPFLELSPLAAHGIYGDDLPGAGIVTGIGRVSGRECIVVANDPTVKGGTYYPITVKKHLRAQEIAGENRPALHLSGGKRRRLSAGAGRGVPGSRALRAHLLSTRRRYRPQGIAQIAVVHGSCTAGGRLRSGDVGSRMSSCATRDGCSSADRRW